MQSERVQNGLYFSLIAFAGLLPVSIALVQPAAYLAALFAVIVFFRDRTRDDPAFPFNRWIMVFLVIVLIASLLGERPGTSLEKMNRFLLFTIAWAIPFVFREPGCGSRSLHRLAVVFLLGIAFKAAYDFIRVPALTQMGVPLFNTGTMRDPQFYLAAICLAAGLLFTGRWTLRYVPTAAGFVLACGALILHFKRGAWIACLAGLAVMALVARKTRWLGGLALCVVLLAAIPQVRERVGQLTREFDPEKGGRLVLWTEVAPVLIPAHPLGMGWKAVKHEDFLAITDKVEPGLNHLHNNFLQLTLELGVAGMLAWTVLMASVLWTLYRAAQADAGGDDGSRGLALGLFGAVSGLLINGLVEYNFGDSEIFMLMMLFMGMAAGLSRLGARGGAI